MTSKDSCRHHYALVVSVVDVHQIVSSDVMTSMAMKISLIIIWTREVTLSGHSRIFGVDCFYCDES